MLLQDLKTSSHDILCFVYPVCWFLIMKIKIYKKKKLRLQSGLNLQHNYLNLFY